MIETEPRSESKFIETAFNSHNYHLKSAKRGSKVPDLAIVVIVTLGIMIGGSFYAGTFVANHLGSVLVHYVAGVTTSPLLFSVYQALWLCASSIPIYLLLWRWLKWYERRKFSTLGFVSQGWLLKSLLGAAGGLLIAGGIIAILQAFRAIKLEQGIALTGGQPTIAAMLLPLLGLAIYAVAQEVVFRGWFLPVVGSRYNWKMGVLLSALMSAVSNIFSLSNTLELMNVTLLGIFLALYAMQEGSIWGACGFQTLWLWANNNLFGYPNQTQFALNSIVFHVRPIAPDLLSGGNAGLRSSLVMTMILLLLSAGLFAYNYHFVSQSAVPDSLASAAKFRLRNSRRNARRSRRS